jgi:hypothetical protein
MTSSSLSDYSEIISVSIGLNIVYIAISSYLVKPDPQAGFYNILSDFVTRSTARIKLKCTDGLANLNNLHEKLVVWRREETLSTESTLVVNKVDSLLIEINKTVECATEQEISKVKKVIDFSFYPQISLSLTIYGLFLLFIMPLEKRLNLDLRGLLFCLNGVTLFSILHSVFWEFSCFSIKGKLFSKKTTNYINKTFLSISKIGSPRFRYILVGILIYIIFLLSILQFKDAVASKVKSLSPFIYRNSYIFAVLLVYSNFIFYFIYCVGRIKISEKHFKKSLKKEEVDTKVRDYGDLLRSVKEEIDSKPLKKVSEIDLTEKIIDKKRDK